MTQFREAGEMTLSLTSTYVGCVGSVESHRPVRRSLRLTVSVASVTPISLAVWTEHRPSEMKRSRTANLQWP